MKTHNMNLSDIVIKLFTQSDFVEKKRKDNLNDCQFL